jgi:manganese/zinc/iron transport system ATP- binding protein
MDKEVVKVSQLTVTYEKAPVLWDVNFSIPAGGHLVAIIGPNGAGKSTLLKALLGLVQPNTGLVEFFGQKIAYMPQRGEIDWEFPITAYEVVLMGGLREGFLGFPTSRVHKQAKQVLDRIGMTKFAQKPISSLSGGQQQRLFIGRALMQDADIYLMDEPFAGIDATTEGDLMAMFRILRDHGKTLIIVHHDLGTIKAYFDWIIVLNSCLIAAGPVSTLFNPEILLKAYGRTPNLFNNAVRHNWERQTGKGG